MAPRNAVAGPYAKQAVRFLQLCSLVLLALGILNQLPIPGVGPNLLFIPSIVAGVSGVLGLSFTWHRALVVYTLSAWLALAFTVWQIANLALHDPANVIAWIMWLASAVFTVPAAFLSTTLHAVRAARMITNKPKAVHAAAPTLTKEEQDARVREALQRECTAAKQELDVMRHECEMVRQALAAAQTQASVELTVSVYLQVLANRLPYH